MIRRLLAERRLQSLRWRLLAGVCAAVLLLGLFIGWVSYTQAQHEAEELMDGNLAQTGRLLLAILHDNEDNLDELASRLATVRGAADNVYEPPLEFQLGHGDGTIVVRSLDAPDLPVLGVPGYSDIIRHTESWRVLNVVSEDGEYRVQVSQSIALRDQAALEVAWKTVLPLALIVPVLLLLIYFSIRRALRPLEALADEVSARSPDNLLPLNRTWIPTEARPLVAEINRLFERVGRTLDNERRFTADAAHEMRTPLAALKVQTQVAQLSQDPAQRQHALRQIECGVDRATRLVEQLLRLARLDPLNTLASQQPVDLHALVDSVCDLLFSANPEAATRIVKILPGGRLTVAGDLDLLQIALRNLLDNALRYTPADCPIRIEAVAHDGRLDLGVHDLGPGVPDDALARLGERFFRGRDNRIEGNGLGLAIVARIAELHGARLIAENPPAGGFRVRLAGLSPAGT